MIFRVHLVTLLIVSEILDSIEYFLVLHFNTAWFFLLSNSGTDFMEQIVDTVSGALRDLPYAQSDDTVCQRRIQWFSVFLSLVEYSYTGQVVQSFAEHNIMVVEYCKTSQLDMFISVIKVSSFS